MTADEALEQARVVLEVCRKVRLVVCLPLLDLGPDRLAVSNELAALHGGQQRVEQRGAYLALGHPRGLPGPRTAA